MLGYKDLVANKYYSVEFIHNNKDYLWYFRFHSFEIYKDGNNGECVSINIDDYYIDNGIFKTGETFTYEKDDKYNEVEFSEIVNFLPENNKEKIIYNRKKRIDSLLTL